MQMIEAIDTTLDVDLISRPIAQQLTDLSVADWEKLRTQILVIYDRSLNDVGNRIDVRSMQLLTESIIPSYISNTPSDRGALISRFITPFIQINVAVDKARTQQAQITARAKVAPVTVAIQQGENIVRAGDVVTPVILEKLTALGVLSLRVTWYEILGQILMAGVLAVVFAASLWHVDRNAATRATELWALVILMVVAVILTRIGAGVAPMLVVASPLVMAALLVSTFYGLRSALLVTITVGFAVFLIGKGSLALGLPPFMAAIVGSIMTRRVDRSLAFVVAGCVAMLTSMVTALGVLLMIERQTDWNAIWPLLAISGGGALLSALLALSLCGIFGTLAGMVSGLQLLELAHPAQPLLQRLVREAPGTYYHSVAVGNLAESAAEAINADGLLLRVASYYHDIGKVEHPFYFTDNQSDGVNLHDSLPPHKSAQIIIDHVRNGIVMARTARLPVKLIDFIATHHGTSVVRYFYHKALEADASTDIADFTYPGPIPTSREQVIMMLADSVEATVRSKVQSGAVASKIGDGQTIDALVTSIIDERMQNGQLADAQVTLHDITRIREAFITTLKGIYHPRVDYSPAKKIVGEPVVEPQGHI
jgi:putative nucleotidyltransferase with HDIG domain